jgi:hypothetical protein
VDFCALQRYTEKRDQFYRAQVALPPKWEGINPNLALSCLPAEPTNTRHFIENAGRIWHKSYRYGTNRLKGLSNSDEALTKAKCLHCDKVESPSTSMPSVEILPCVNKGKESLTPKPKPLTVYA